jgi:hypothetical protein
MSAFDELALEHRLERTVNPKELSTSANGIKRPSNEIDAMQSLQTSAPPKPDGRRTRWITAAPLHIGTMTARRRRRTQDRQHIANRAPAATSFSSAFRAAERVFGDSGQFTPARLRYLWNFSNCSAPMGYLFRTARSVIREPGM